MPPEPAAARPAVTRPSNRSKDGFTTTTRHRQTRITRTGTTASPPRRGTPTVVANTTLAMTCMIVAIPARDETARITACLASIDDAAARCPVPVFVTVAADTCHDDTAIAARQAPTQHIQLQVIEGRWHAAGRARAAAVDATLASLSNDLSTVWIANTDADCVVRPTWLQQHVGHANAGAHALAGVVALDPATTATHLLAEFTATYHLASSTHRHVHAANLGLRADAYHAVGGWSTHTVVGEDHDLWRRLVAAGLQVHQRTDIVVTTSSRTVGRVVGGFASALSRLNRPGHRRRSTAS